MTNPLYRSNLLVFSLPLYYNQSMSLSPSMWCAAFALLFLLVLAEVRVVWAFCVPKTASSRAKWGTAALVSAVTVAADVALTLGVGSSFLRPDAVMVAAAFVAVRFFFGCSLHRACAAAGGLFALSWGVYCLLNLFIEALLKSALS